MVVQLPVVKPWDTSHLSVYVPVKDFYSAVEGQLPYVLSVSEMNTMNSIH